MNRFEEFDYLMLSPTGACNLKCKQCTRVGKSGSYTRGIKVIADHFPNIKQIKLQGLGEPMLNNNFESMCKQLRMYYPGAHILTITNGTLGMDYFRNSLKLFQVNELYVSIDSVKNDPNKVYSEIILSMKVLNEIAYTQNLPIYINTTLYDYNSNADELQEIVNLLDEFINIRGIRVQHHQDWNDVSKITYIDDSKIPDSFLLHPKVQFIGRGDFEYKDCLWNTKRIQINEDGIVKLCCLKTNFDLDRIDKMEDFVQYNDDFKYCIERNIPVFAVCETCSYKLLNKFNDKIIKRIEDLKCKQ